MLDTNICVDLLRGRRRMKADRLKESDLDSVCVSVITLAELLYGAFKSRDPSSNERAVIDFCAAIDVAPFNGQAAAAYGRLRTDLERVGSPIGPLDTLIASHALALDLTVVTDNESEFRRVAGLRVENWLAPPR
jgi:tRNA(fMet)-specific endonuclease VapC